MAEVVIGKGEQVPTTVPFDGDLGELVGRYVGQARGQTLAVTVALSGDTLTVAPGKSQPLPARHIGDFTFTDSTGVVLYAFRCDRGHTTELRVDAVSGHYVLVRQAR